MRVAHFLLMVWDRLEYTQMTLSSFLRTASSAKLHIVDNGSQARTKEWLAAWAKANSPSVASYVRHPTNLGIAKPTQAFWEAMQKAKEPWFGKIDNDIEFVSAGWVGRLTEVLERCPSVGVASVCHFARDFEREVKAGQSKVVTEGGVQFNPRSHVGGCGYLMRAEVQKKVGPLMVHKGIYSWTLYQEQINQAGYKTAYAYPFVPVGHLGEWADQRIKSKEYQDYAKKILDMRRPPKK